MSGLRRGRISTWARTLRSCRKACFMRDCVRPFRLKQNGPVLGMMAVTGFVESVLVWRVFHEELSLPYAAAFHLLVLTAIAAQALVLIKQGKDLRLSFILFSFTLSIGPAGAPATLLTA